MNMLGIMVSTYHLVRNFLLTLGDIITMHVNHPTTRKCYTDSLRERPRSPPRRTMNNVEKIAKGEEVDLDPRVSNEIRVESIESTKRYRFSDEHRYTHVSKTLVDTQRCMKYCRGM